MDPSPTGDGRVANGTGAAWHGTHDVLTLENELIRLALVPELGARVISLRDRQSGREWLVEGRPSAGMAAPDAVFGGAEAYGWDECLPTVAACPDPLVRGRVLRDHGDAWGRATGTVRDSESIENEWVDRRWRWRFRRRLRLTGGTVVAGYELLNEAAVTLPFLYAMHALLAVEPGSRIELPGGVRQLDVTWQSAAVAADASLRWPNELQSVAGVESGVALKGYATPPGVRRGSVVATDGARLTVATESPLLPALGIWLNYGGWPVGDPRHQIALEPTTSPDDDLCGALSRRRALEVPAGQRLEWAITIESSSDTP